MTNIDRAYHLRCLSILRWSEKKKARAWLGGAKQKQRGQTWLTHIAVKQNQETRNTSDIFDVFKLFLIYHLNPSRVYQPAWELTWIKYLNK